MLLTNTQALRLHKAFRNVLSANIKLSKTQLHEIGQSRRFLGTLLGPLLKTRYPLMKNVLKPFAKIILIPLGLTAEPSVTDAAIHKKTFVFGTTTLAISNEEMNEIMNIIYSFEESDLLIKGVSKPTENEAKDQKGGFLSMLLDTAGASLLRNLLTGKRVMRVREGTIRTG